MKTYTFHTEELQLPADCITPVELFLKIRDIFPGSFLLESSDHESVENSYTYICFDRIASFRVSHKETQIHYPDTTIHKQTADIQIEEELNGFLQQFESQEGNYEFATNGVFGYTSYDAIPLYNDIQFKKSEDTTPLVEYFVFRYVWVFNHYRSTIHCFEHNLEGDTSELRKWIEIFYQPKKIPGKFRLHGQESTEMSDSEFLSIIHKGIQHCQRGDVFQVVLSREFKQQFIGDDFQVYRALRSVNPSPYLFYFDLLHCRVFGSSPEAQLIIKNHKAYINPIAGTFKRTGEAEKDMQLAKQLSNDPKENAEHIMLVDLARNDLSKSSSEVVVEKFKEVEMYSHVIHLVSKISATLPEEYNPITILGETYPAGTLSGAPKHRAMQIIDENEPDNRGFYGGGVGCIGFNGEINHAIFIRSFTSKNKELSYRAGCGVVIKSDPQSELEEVNNKLGALRKALQIAEKY